MVIVGQLITTITGSICSMKWPLCMTKSVNDGEDQVPSYQFFLDIEYPIILLADVVTLCMSVRPFKLEHEFNLFRTLRPFINYCVSVIVV